MLSDRNKWIYRERIHIPGRMRPENLITKVARLQAWGIVQLSAVSDLAKAQDRPTAFIQNATTKDEPVKERPDAPAGTVRADD